MQHHQISHVIGSSALVALGLLMLPGCAGAGASTPPAASPVVESSAVETIETRYNDAISQSAVVTPTSSLPLMPLKPEADGTFRVTTWAGCRGSSAPGKCGSYVANSPVDLAWDVWVTGNNEVQTKCQGFTGDLILQIAELLGMPAPEKPLPPDTMERQFVTFSGVPADNIFRPCTDTRIDTDHCDIALPASLPSNAPPDYYKWFTNQAMSSWQITPTGQPPKGFPWTRLGYTFNWAKGAANPYGASEYVISGSLKHVRVNVVSVQTAQAYCKGQTG